MSIAAKQLISLAEEPDEIPFRVAELCTSPSSANRHLANTVDTLIKNKLAIDRIYIYQEDAQLPKKPNIFASAGMNIKRFVTSFTDQAYSTGNTDPEHLQVWVNRSSQYVQIMQKMIDEYFTPQTGIEVDISIMPDQYKLVLANTSGKAPDVATGINYTIPYELAIRGALVEMTQFDDFKEVAAPYEDGFFLTSGKQFCQVCKSVHGLRAAQRRALLGGSPVQGAAKLMDQRCRTVEVPHQQHTGHGLVVVQSSHLQFRQHVDHIDYAAYNLLSNAAPELKNSWSIALVPGMEREDGSVDRTVCGCAESSVIFKSDSEREAKAWEFVKWWSSTEVQAEFGQTLQITYGNEYMWTTANMDAFMQKDNTTASSTGTRMNTVNARP